MTEIAGHGRTSIAAYIVAALQADGETSAWVQQPGAGVFPPDLAAAGVDLDALVVVHVPPRARPARAAEWLLASGAFGVVVVEVGRDDARGPWLARLAGHARTHAASLIVLTPSGEHADSLGPWVSVRAWTRRGRPCAGECMVDVKLTKNKAGVTLLVPSTWRGPPGL